MNPKLVNAINDAQTLLSHAASSGTTIDPPIVDTIVATGNLFTAGNVPNTQESAFWEAFDKLAKAVAPVTVSSLRATMDSHAGISGRRILGLKLGGGSLARRAVRWYTVIALMALAVLLLVQIYWMFGVSITGDIQTVKRDYEGIQAKLEVIARTPADQSAKSPAAKGDSSRSQSEKRALETQRDNLVLQGETSYELLKGWSRFWERDDWVRTYCSGASEDDQGRIAACERIARYGQVTVVLNVLQRYLLPLLYGLLGACVYILRTLATQIRARTYAESSNIDFRIRLYLGTLGGMVSAWFLTPEAADGLFKSLSPFALSFLAGYSVEVLFWAMDRVITAFVSNGGNGRTTAREKP